MLVFMSLYPLDKGSSLSKYVARSLDIIDSSGLDYQLTSMGTLIEGEPDQVWDLIRKCHQAMREVSGRVAAYIKIDDHVGKTGRLKGKAKSVEEKLGRKLND